MAVRIGQLLDGKYRVVRVLGKGGMGAVYEGENTLISRRVAIKVLHPDLMLKRDIVTRFELEAQAAGRIQNDHINEVLDLGTLEDGSRFIVLEFLEGETLKDRVKRAGRLTPMQAVHVVRQVLVGLSAAHRAGIVHRDLKPGNVFILWEKLGQRDFVKIIDFGVSKFLLSPESEELDAAHATTVLGTPHYMAPEQLRRSGGVDARADLYSVGIILYKAVTGRVPYHAHSVRELLVKLTTTAPVPAAHWVAGLEPAFLRILDKAIQRDVDKRFQSSDEFLAELEQWRMEMTASELPYFTEDGLMSTMHNVSLKRGSSSEVSVPPVHVSAPGTGTDSVSVQELSEVSLASMPSANSGPAQVQSTGDAARSLQRPPSWGPRVAAVVLVIAAMGGVAAGGWYLSRTLRPPVSTAEALVEPSDSSVAPTDAVPLASSAIVEPPPTAVEPSPADGEPKQDEPVISVTELPTEPGAPPGPAVRVDPGATRTNGPIRPGGKKEEPKNEPASEWGY